MYLHIGNQVNIREKDIIGIFDADRTTVSKITRKFLTKEERRGLVESAAEEIPKSFILYRDPASGEYRVYFSQLSVAALEGRM